jgi:DNA-binding MarR family transcriptional regulator
MQKYKLDDLKICAQTCAAANVRRSSRAITRFYAGFFSSLDLEPTQYSLLVASALAEGITVSKLADMFVMDRSTLARNLALMEKNGLIKIDKGEDKRTRIIKLTKDGESALSKAMPLWQKAQKEIELNFGSKRLTNLINELKTLTQLTHSE